MTAPRGRSAGPSVGLAYAQFEALIRRTMPYAADGAREIFDSSLAALRSSGLTPPSAIFSDGANPVEMFSAMQARISASLLPSTLNVVARTVLVALGGGVAALALAELLGISIGLACVIVAVVALVWWVGGVRKLLDHLGSVIKTELDKISFL